VSGANILWDVCVAVGAAAEPMKFNRDTHPINWRLDYHRAPAAIFLGTPCSNDPVGRKDVSVQFGEDFGQRHVYSGSFHA
jgi:hypothetical protein